ncbi:MAG: Dabb family protein [Nitriliruptoraceae bacterium]
MLRHTVIMTFADDLDSAGLDRVVAGMKSLSGIPEVRSLHVGLDAGISDRSADLILTVDFDDAAAWQTYQDHPDHVAFVSDIVAPVLLSRAAVQVEIDD